MVSLVFLFAVVFAGALWFSVRAHARSRNTLFIGSIKWDIDADRAYVDWSEEFLRADDATRADILNSMIDAGAPPILDDILVGPIVVLTGEQIIKGG